jgi:hypothetical protein
MDKRSNKRERHGGEPELLLKLAFPREESRTDSRQ